MTSIFAELTQLSFILYGIDVLLLQTLILYCDNLSALHMTIYLVFHAHSKHTELHYHYVHKKVAHGNLSTSFVPLTNQWMIFSLSHFQRLNSLIYASNQTSSSRLILRGAKANKNIKILIEIKIIMIYALYCN